MAGRARGGTEGGRRLAAHRARGRETRVAALLDERRRLERELAEAKKALALGGGGSAPAAADEDVGGVKFSGQVLQGLNPKDLRGLLDEAKKRLGSGVAAVVAVNEGRATFAV